MTVSTRCRLVTFMQCGELLYSMRFPLKLKMVVYKSYRKPAILYESEALAELKCDGNYTKDRDPW